MPMSVSGRFLNPLQMTALTSNVSEIGLKYRPTRIESRVIRSSSDAYDLLIRWFDKDTIFLQEQFLVAYLDRKNSVTSVYRASRGGITGTVADPRLIVTTALKTASSGIILCHNHPSGNLIPSRMDEELTNKIKQGAAWLDISLLDHLIVSPAGEYFSMADQGLI
jgi:DNA repair protein RadC